MVYLDGWGYRAMMTLADIRAWNKLWGGVKNYTFTVLRDKNKSPLDVRVL